MGRQKKPKRRRKKPSVTEVQGPPGPPGPQGPIGLSATITEAHIEDIKRRLWHEIADDLKRDRDLDRLRLDVLVAALRYSSVPDAYHNTKEFLDFCAALERWLVRFEPGDRVETE